MCGVSGSCALGARRPPHRCGLAARVGSTNQPDAQRVRARCARICSCVLTRRWPRTPVTALGGIARSPAPSWLWPRGAGRGPWWPRGEHRCGRRERGGLRAAFSARRATAWSWSWWPAVTDGWLLDTSRRRWVGGADCACAAFGPSAGVGAACRVRRAVGAGVDVAAGLGVGGEFVGRRAGAPRGVPGHAGVDFAGHGGGGCPNLGQVRRSRYGPQCGGHSSPDRGGVGLRSQDCAESVAGAWRGRVRGRGCAGAWLQLGAHRR